MTDKWHPDKRFLIKCDCERCNCPSATTDGVCYECTNGFHVTHWHDGEVVRAKEIARREVRHD